MTYWRRKENIWCLWPARPVQLFEMIGGSYLGSSPQISYKRLLEELFKKHIAIHAWRYIPGLDHQAQSNEAWKEFRKSRENLENRVGCLPKSIRIGHSLGCKLHLLAPDGGRNSKGFISLSFNNFGANNSIPMLKKLAPKFGLQTEFTPNPKETMSLISKNYIQSKNLLIKFNNDNIDQSELLLDYLKGRDDDNSNELILEGDHLTPASTGISKNLLGNLVDNSYRYNNLKEVVKVITKWSESL